MDANDDKEESGTIVPLDLSCENLIGSPKLDTDNNSIQYLFVPIDNGGGDGIGYKRKNNSLLSSWIIKKAKVLRFGDQNISVEGLHEVDVNDDTEPSNSISLSNSVSSFTKEENSFRKHDQFDPITQSWFTSKQSKDNLAEQGHNWKQGVWSKDEIAILKRNIEEYIEIENLSNPQEVIFRMNKDERKGFYRFIAKGLNRPLFAVYRKIIRMYDSKNHVGKYSMEDIAKLKGLHDQYGNDWASIGTAMGRSASSVKDKFRLLKPCSRQGKWTPEEEHLLAESVYELTGAVPGSSVTTGVSWNQVAKQVSTRSEKQCRTKWLNYLNWKKTGGTYWLKEDDDKLIEKLILTGLQIESAINWDELAQGWRSVRSPQWLRAKWWSLKRHVPNHNQLSYQEILALLKSGEVAYGTRPRCDPSASSISMDSLQGLSTQIKMSDLIGKSFTLQLPIHLTNQDSTSHPPAITTGDEDLTSPTYHTYEVIPSSMTLTPTSALFIQSPTSHSSASLSDSSTDHIIAPSMHTIPATSLHSNGNVTVQINQSAHEHLIINQSTCTDEALQSIHHSDDMQQGSSRLVVHGHSDNGDDMVGGQVQLIGTDAVLSHQLPDPSTVEPTLVIVNTAVADLCASSSTMDDTNLANSVFALADSF